MQIIVLFCIIDDFLKAIAYQDDVQAKMTTAEVITVAIAAGMFFGGNHEKSRIFFKDHRYIKNMLSKSQFNRRLHAINSNVWKQLHYILAQVFIQTNENREFVVDSFPVAVCHNIRISRSKIYRTEEYRGYSASKREYFWGIRVHMISSIHGGPVEIIFAPGSVSDAKIAQVFDFDLPKGSILYGDSMYGIYTLEDDLKEDLDITLLASRKSNMKKQHEPHINFLISHFRKTTENTFSRITSLFPKRIHAVTNKGFELKVFALYWVIASDFYRSQLTLLYTNTRYISGKPLSSLGK